MTFKRIDNHTINCIITPEDMHARGLRIDDLFDRKEEARAFLHSVLNEAMEKVDFHPQGGMTSMQMSVLPDHSVSLTISEQPASQFNTLLKDFQDKLGITLPEDFRQELMKLSDDERLERLRDYAARISSGTDEVQEKSTAAAPEVSGSGSDEKTPGQFVFHFSTFRAVTACAKYLAGGKRQKRPEIPAELYADGDNGFYLILSEPESGHTEYRKLVLSVNEFGRLITANTEFQAHIREHNTCILKEETIRTLAGL